MEMQTQGLGSYYSATLSGVYNGMIIEYYIQAVNSEGIIQTFPNKVTNFKIILKFCYIRILITFFFTAYNK